MNEFDIRKYFVISEVLGARHATFFSGFSRSGCISARIGGSSGHFYYLLLGVVDGVGGVDGGVEEAYIHRSAEEQLGGGWCGVVRCGSRGGC